MIAIHPDCPPGVTLLADHLDAALAAGEDLLDATLAARADLDESDAETAPEAMDVFVRRLMQCEASLLLRVFQARRLAEEIGHADATLRAAGALFRAQTDALHALIMRAGKGPDGQLVRAGDSHAYLRSRGMIAPEAAAPSPFESLSVDESFRIGGVAVLGQMLDLVSSFLDLLDVRFGLYSPDVEDTSVTSDQAASDAAPEAHDAEVHGLPVDNPPVETSNNPGDHAGGEALLCVDAGSGNDASSAAAVSSREGATAAGSDLPRPG